MDSDPLFLGHQGGGGEWLLSRYRSEILRASKASGLVTKEVLAKADFSPSRPTALRSAFSSNLSNHLSQGIIDHFLGHCDQYNNAYKVFSPKTLEDAYRGVMKELSISDGADKLSKFYAVK